ncbi:MULTISPECIES: DNA polymerase III subunit gamma and tau [unclassified Arthrobacter]|uniref:DNA polymerase III subunit gamma and tau n=1 Tax=unclassified Arthrobacter TaxID=235627 RepID=UPI0024DFC806|nr:MULTISPECIES: DNA polymerase III subunit gamma and tau [unclassified Arthrobacter]MCC9144068.1 DNA polymerase III subunit gamma and tau [Arthrobacter sp. zg-Y919]MDK1275293.1 DNA polymerase III subunit gamma and tau [Arthrobacter sp. zg.Y919]WIB03312.1 DNA polymerase III subunit gamma and tau [Arthrobacter sp. zg-Y919]
MSTALYRRYRPESFADVIGQEHVTEPLMAALQKNRVNHAYLFSGPRGCGKTTSARILARCLNCAEGPTPVPCGKCDSCVELARDGSGSLDVIEIDAASHGGVDDARDLRERATFAPVRDRYKIFIIDEAHMVTSAGFNALLKIVEEPPEHIKFIFATTEPDKVIGTIRSRTHHYPFRLVPPEPLLAYLEKLCTQENVSVAPGVLSLVIRAGGGSVRDTLSVLDQLMAGAGPDGLDYELAVSLLGYTPVSLLDDVVDAVAAADAGTVFRAVDRVIQTGQDPRRFVEDLLERFRDLIIVNAMPDSAATVLRGLPEDQISRMQTQATQLGGSELSRAADITNTALTEMTGATSPRLHLELLCARILLPAADQAERGTAARVDRLERRLSYAGDPTEAMGRAAAAASPVNTIPAAAPTASQSAASAPAVDEAPSSPRGIDFAATPTPDAAAANSPTAPEAGRGDNKPAGSSLDWGGTWATPAQAPESAAASTQAAAQGSNGSRPAEGSNGSRPDAAPAGAAPAEAPAATPAPAESTSTTPVQQSQPQQQDATRQAPTGAPAAGAGQIEMIRRAWPEIMDALTSIRRATWLNVSKNSSPRAFDGKVLELAFTNPGAATNFNRPDHLENLRKAIHQVLALDCQIKPIHDSSASAGESGPKADSRRPPASAPAAKPPVVQASPAVQAPAPQERVEGSVPGSADKSGTAPAPAQPEHPAQGSADNNSGTAPADQAPAVAQQPQAAATEVSSAKPSAAPVAWPAAVGPNEAPSPAGPVASAAHVPGPAAAAPANAAPVNAATAALRRRAGNANAGTDTPSGGSPSGASPSGGQGNTSRSNSGRSGKAGTAAGGRAAGRSGGNRASDEPWPDEPSDPFNDAPESNAWETAEAPVDVYSGGHLSDSEWASTDWAGTGSTTRPAAGNAAPASQPVPAAGTRGPGTGVPASASPTGLTDRTSKPGTTAVPAKSSGPAAAPAVTAAPPAAASPAAPGGKPNQPLSRYQKLLNEAAQCGGNAPVRGGRPVDSTYVEDVPSADDITLEDSGMVGRKAIERILGGRLIEERSLDGR